MPVPVLDHESSRYCTTGNRILDMNDKHYHHLGGSCGEAYTDNAKRTICPIRNVCVGKVWAIFETPAGLFLIHYMRLINAIVYMIR